MVKAWGGGGRCAGPRPSPALTAGWGHKDALRESRRRTCCGATGLRPLAALRGAAAGAPRRRAIRRRRPKFWTAVKIVGSRGSRRWSWFWRAVGMLDGDPGAPAGALLPELRRRRLAGTCAHGNAQDTGQISGQKPGYWSKPRPVIAQRCNPCGKSPALIEIRWWSNVPERRGGRRRGGCPEQTAVSRTKCARAHTHRSKHKRAHTHRSKHKRARTHTRTPTHRSWWTTRQLTWPICCRSTTCWPCPVTS